MIIQGTNVPIVFTFPSNMESILDIEIHLYDQDEEELKHWTITDVTIEGEKVFAPFLQEETLDFPPGRCTIEVKWLDKDGRTNFAKDLKNTIVRRTDKTIMSGGL